nr:hypothetical protein [Leptolyngbya sp. Prado105]
LQGIAIASRLSYFFGLLYFAGFSLYSPNLWMRPVVDQNRIAQTIYEKTHHGDFCTPNGSH